MNIRSERRTIERNISVSIDGYISVVYFFLAEIRNCSWNTINLNVIADETTDTCRRPMPLSAAVHQNCHSFAPLCHPQLELKTKEASLRFLRRSISKLILTSSESATRFRNDDYQWLQARQLSRSTFADLTHIKCCYSYSIFIVLVRVAFAALFICCFSFFDSLNVVIVSWVRPVCRRRLVECVWARMGAWCTH